METFALDRDIAVITVTASSFPQGIGEAHQRLHAIVPHSSERNYFGISRPESGTIVYKAAAEEQFDGEAEQLKCGRVVLKKGNYICLPVHDYMQNLDSISRAFETLLKQPGLDPEGYCVEWYTSDKDMKCMIRLND